MAVFVFIAPIIDLGGADELVGMLREDRTIVSIVPELNVVSDTGPICHYELSNDSIDIIPFVAEITDEKRGRGEIRVKEGVHLDCSTPQFHLNLVAIRCSDEVRSESVPLRISIRDTNDHIPEFAQPWFTFDIDEGKIYTEIARLQATDKDCGHPYGQICRYEITNSLDGFPFAIDDQGVLRNTEPLNYTQAKSYILTVVAHDCGMRQSKSTLVTVNVREACVATILNVEDRISYFPGSGDKAIVPEANIVTCAASNSCTVKSVESIITLKSRHIYQGCDRDDIFSSVTQSRCGINPETISLLPVVKEADKEKSNLGDKYAFDGKMNAIIIPPSLVKSLIPQKFTLSFSIKHSKGSKAEQSMKQNIICESDQLNMNRHHFAVYIRHCKLEMLMRRESDAEAAFRAAEWRWNLPEVCDSQWHTYSILFASVDQVDLYVDGKKFLATDENPEILDDWPLHRTKQTKTRLVIGACWHGRSQSMAQFFKGHIASMLFLSNKVEQPQAVLCAHQCKEQLQFTAIDQLVPGEEAIFDKESSVLTLKANTAEDLSLLLQKVSYINMMQSPTPGHRGFQIKTTINCASGKSYSLNPTKGYIFVQKEIDPVLSISGMPIVKSDQQSVKTGARMLPDIKITVTQNFNGEEQEKTSEAMLDWCKVHLKPSRDMELEYFSSSATLIADSHIDFEHDKQGIFLKGKEKATVYRDILSRIHYFNIRADSFDKRIYSVQCAMNGGKISSNEFLITMIIEAPTHNNIANANAASGAEHDAEPGLEQINNNRLQNILEMDLPRPNALISRHGHAASQGVLAAIAMIVIVCVGFLLVLLVIGVLRMQDSPLPRRRKNRKNPENSMEWDNSGMNITINPLEQVEKNAADYFDEESSDDGESYREEGLTDDDDDVEMALPHVQNGRLIY
ncbi:unnamed protein product [Dracunculus medinensis]|uniref:CA domain-containing protein n=1 Tax=Dracunculus medinensis TaxID=318479 RepID=A0A158Q4N5_DRAME|nr:unnamed protein product [Dracunculus medinensis]